MTRELAAWPPAEGGIMRSPASMPEPSYQTRIQNGRIEVRAFT